MALRRPCVRGETQRVINASRTGWAGREFEKVNAGEAENSRAGTGYGGVALGAVQHYHYVVFYLELHPVGKGWVQKMFGGERRIAERRRPSPRPLPKKGEGE